MNYVTIEFIDRGHVRTLKFYNEKDAAEWSYNHGNIDFAVVETRIPCKLNFLKEIGRIK